MRATRRARVFLTVGVVVLLAWAGGSPPAPGRADHPPLTFVEHLRSAPFPLDEPDESLVREYKDDGVLFHIPAGFDPREPFLMVVLFHGHLTDVRAFFRTYAFADQAERSGKNVVLIAPELTGGAIDSSPGKFGLGGGFRRFLDEAAEVLAVRLGEEFLPRFRSAPVILAAHSGGYKPLAMALDRGGAVSRVRGVLLLDALYGDADRFEHWLTRTARPDAFFINLYTEGPCRKNSERLAESLAGRGLPAARGWPVRLVPAPVVRFILSDQEHSRIPLDGPPRRPLEKLLRLLGE